MSKPRQAQQEIEKKLQQVEEGYANFQSIWKKFQSANSSVKEKLETEMQKEIKRFQGIKEALKGVDSLEPRFKARINDAKKKIEDVIEFHKQIERDSKVKVISKEPPVSLKNDQQEEKEELRQALRSFLASFQEKVTVRESEIEKCKNSKMRISMVDDLNRQIRVLRYHSDKTEAVLKQIDSDSVHPNFVWNLCEKFEIFLKSEDIAEDDQEIEHAYKDIGINSKPLKNFPSLNDDEHQPHKRSNSKKQDNKPVGRTGDKAVEKAWNSKENLFKSAWKQEKVTEDLPDEDIKNVLGK